MSVGTQPGPYTTPHTAPAGGPPIKNWMTEAIIATIASVCCGGGFCWPMGLIAIIFAAQVNSKLAAGDRAGAEAAAGKAKTFTIIAFALAALGLVAMVILFATGAMAENMNNM